MQAAKVARNCLILFHRRLIVALGSLSPGEVPNWSVEARLALGVRLTFGATPTALEGDNATAGLVRAVQLLGDRQNAFRGCVDGSVAR